MLSTELLYESKEELPGASSASRETCRTIIPALVPEARQRVPLPYRSIAISFGEAILSQAVWDPSDSLASPMKPYIMNCTTAGVAELADAQDLGSCGRKAVGVQIPPSAPNTPFTLQRAPISVFRVAF
jgi:hypothetical protein